MAQQHVGKSKRFSEIIQILLTQRFPALVRDLASYEPGARAAHGPLVSNGTDATSLPVRVRRLLENLGPSFIKIGQLLGARPDLVPMEFVEEFKKLYDQTQPTPFEEVRAQVSAELGKPLEEVFASFDQVPIASASIAQVHRASLHDGSPVAVKVQHPGIESRVTSDFEILRTIVRFTERVFSASRIWQPVEHLEELRHMLGEELDFRNELMIQKKVLQNFAGVETVKVPAVHERYCTRRVLTMEFIDGVTLEERNQPGMAAMDHKRLARNLAEAMATQMFVHRLFHADPSPGNLLFLEGNRICFLDFGAFGHVTRRRAATIISLLTELGKGDVDGTARAVLELCEQQGEYDQATFERDIERVLDYYETERASLANPEMLERILSVSQRHNLLLPPDFMLVTRALYQFDGICTTLDPDYELVETLTPFVARLARQRLTSTESQIAGARDSLVQLVHLGRHLPERLDRLLTMAERGEITAKIEVQGNKELARQRSITAAITAISALVGLLMVGGAVIATTADARALSTYVFVSGIVIALWLVLLVLARARLKSQ